MECFDLKAFLLLLWHCGILGQAFCCCVWVVFVLWVLYLQQENIIKIVSRFLNEMTFRSLFAHAIDEEIRSIKQ